MDMKGRLLEVLSLGYLFWFCQESSALSSVPVMRCDVQLRGHTARITDIDWSPHQPQLLVSSSYDGTAQVDLSK